MCYSNSSTSKNVDLSQKYKKAIPPNLDEKPVYFASGFDFPKWRIITNDDTIQSMNWGLVPSWYNGNNPNEIAAMTLNAKVESLDEKASFKNLLHRTTCIVPSTGFYEWKHQGKEKIPFFIYPANDSIFSMAGLYDTWINPLNGDKKRTFTIVTCEANSLMAEIHNTKKRMPLILSNSQENEWLNGQLTIPDLILPGSESMQSHEINRKLISERINSPEVQKPFKNEFYEQGSLF